MKSHPRHTQRLIGFIAKHSFRAIAALFLCSYVLVCIYFALLYHTGNCLSLDPNRFSTNLYFSFITQATVGYGDYAPTGYGRFLACVQVLSGLVWFGLGTAVLVMKLLTPSESAVQFDRHLAYDPRENRFRIRYVNTLPIELHNLSLEMRLRRIRRTPWGHRKTTRRTISLLKNQVPRLPSLRPFLSSTRPPSQAARIRTGEDILTPELITNMFGIEVVVSGTYFAGSVVASHTYLAADTVCGIPAPTYEEDEPVDWDKWDEVIPPTAAECSACPRHASCIMKQSEQSPPAYPEGRADAPSASAEA